MEPPYNPDYPDLDIIDVGELAQTYCIERHGDLTIREQLATGVAVHFGDHALFVPGEDHQKLQERVLQKIEELACAYAAWDYAVEQSQKEEGHE